MGNDRLEFKVVVPNKKNYADVMSEINHALDEYNIAPGEYGQVSHIFGFRIPDFKGDSNEIYKRLAKIGYKEYKPPKTENDN